MTGRLGVIPDEMEQNIQSVTGRTLLAITLPQHANEHGPKDSILLAVDQEFGESPGLGITPELADPVGPVEVGQHQDVEQFGAGSGT